jgi:hypothetical protein
MQIHLLDFRGFDEHLEVPEPCTVSQLRDLIASQFGYSMHTSALCHTGAILNPRDDLTRADITDDNTFVLFNERLFPVKAYPTVDQAFRFFPTRYQEFYSEIASHRFSSPIDRNAQLARIREFIADGEEHLRAIMELAYGRSPHGVDFPALRDPALPRPFGGDGRPLFGRAGRGPAMPIRLGPRFFERELPAAAREAEDVPDHMIPPGVELPPEDRAAVARLAGATGIDLHTVIQVFCACDRNEAVAEGCLIAMA